MIIRLDNPVERPAVFCAECHKQLSITGPFKYPKYCEEHAPSRLPYAIYREIADEGAHSVSMLHYVVEDPSTTLIRNQMIHEAEAARAEASRSEIEAFA